MRKFLFLIMVCFIVITTPNAEELKKQENVKFGSDIDKAINYPDKKNIQVRYAKTPAEFAEGTASNLQHFKDKNEGKEVGSVVCVVHVLDNGNLALTFFNDEELQKFHEETDFVLNKYYGGYDITSFQNITKNTQTHLTTMILKRIEKKKRFGFK